MTDQDIPDDVFEVLTDLLAMERDRGLGYPADELHKRPRDVLQETIDVLDAHGYNTEEIVWQDDREALGLE